MNNEKAHVQFEHDRENKKTGDQYEDEEELSEKDFHRLEFVKMPPDEDPIEELHNRPYQYIAVGHIILEAFGETEEEAQENLIVFANKKFLKKYEE